MIAKKHRPARDIKVQILDRHSEDSWSLLERSKSQSRLSFPGIFSDKVCNALLVSEQSDRSNLVTLELPSIKGESILDVKIKR